MAMRKLFTSAAKASSSHVQAARSVKTLQERVTELRGGDRKSRTQRAQNPIQ